MDRRAFIAHGLAVIVGSGIGYAQPLKPNPRIGYLVAVPLSETPSLERVAFIDGLRKLGYVDRQTITIEYRSAGGNFELLDDLAAELVKLNVDIIAATGFQATLAAKNTTKTDRDDRGRRSSRGGLVENLAKPGGNVTGLTLSFPELGGKRVELLKEAVPKLNRLAVVWNSQNVANIEEWNVVQSAARTLGVALESFSVKQASDLLNAFTTIPKYRPGGLVTILDSLIGPYRQLIAKFALEQRIPPVLSLRDYAEFGGLMSYGPSLPEIYRRAATYVDKLLRGAKPGDLPIEPPTTFEFVINLKTAQALGLSVPRTLLRRADQVIE